MTHFLPIERTAEHTYALRVTEALCVGPDRARVPVRRGGARRRRPRAGADPSAAASSGRRRSTCRFARLGSIVELDVAVRTGGPLGHAGDGRRPRRWVHHLQCHGLAGRARGLSRPALARHARYAPAGRLPGGAAAPDAGSQRPPPSGSRRALASPTPRARKPWRPAARSSGCAQDSPARSTARRSPSSPTSCLAPLAARLAAAAAATASTTTCASGRSCRPNGCCAMFRRRRRARGFGHGHMRLYAEDGTLMATASQSIVLRSYRRTRAESGLTGRISG